MGPNETDLKKSDPKSEKIWYVFTDNRHEGPYSLDDMQALLDEGRADPTDFVWKEGMVDWELLAKVLAFGPLISAPTPEPKINPSKPTRPKVPLESRPAVPRAKVELKISLQDKLRPHFQMISGLICLLLLASFGVYRATRSSFPQTLEDVSTEEFRELKAARILSLGDLGPGVAVALSTSDLVEPSFYLTTNLPSGARFELHFEGLPGTILNRTTVSGVASISVSRGFVKTPPIRLENGDPLPRGVYRIFVLQANSQPAGIEELLKNIPSQHPVDAPALKQELKVFTRKIYFLGGAQDQEYAQGLQEYHLKLREKGQNELMEIRQYAATLEDQLTQTEDQFQMIIQQERSSFISKKEQWLTFHQRWTRFQKHLDETFQSWTPAQVSGDFYHGSLYGLIGEANELVKQIHLEQASYFESISAHSAGVANLERRALEVRLSDAISFARSTILSLKSKTALAEKKLAAEAP